MDILLAFVLVLSLFIFLFVLRQNASLKGLPPGPPPLPIVGNFLQLRTKPSITITNLSKTYGPLMRVDFGSRRMIIVSSTEMVREVLLKNDLNCSGRFSPYVMEAMNHHEYSMAAMPVGDKWRVLRRVCKEHIFTAQKMEATEELRQQKLQQLRDYLEQCSMTGTVVDIGEAILVTSLNMLSNTVVSVDFAAHGSAAAQEIREALSEAMLIGGTANPVDFFPFLRPFDPKGLQRRTRACYAKILGHLDDIMNKRIKDNQSSSSSSRKSNDLLQVLLDLNQQNELMTLKDIRHLLLDLFLAGGESTSTILQSVMAELLRDPKKMSKAKDEVRRVVGEKRQAVESDIPKLLYLNAMIKETFRYRSGAPFLAPHKVEADVKINGYIIPKGAGILINVWAITRDPNVWPNPNTFDPERFLDNNNNSNNIDYKGQHFELIPFGSGRRICPGIPLFHLSAHLLLAHMIHSFDWKVEGGMELDLDGDEGFIVHRTTPVQAIPIKNNN